MTLHSTDGADGSGLGADRRAYSSRRSLADKVLPLPSAVRTLGLLFAEGASVGLFLWGFYALDIVRYSLQNDIEPAARRVMALTMLGAGAFAVACGVVFWARAPVAAGRRVELTAIRLSPFVFVGLVPFLVRWQIWSDHELTFGVLVSVLGFALHASILASMRAGALTRASSSPLRRALARWLARTSTSGPWVVVLTAAFGYAAFFSYQTILHHHSLLTNSFDMGLEDNLLWNLIHGGSFMKMSPLSGPHGSHFGNHATLFAYVIAPFYALYQRPEALLVFQSTLVGAAAIPLFLFAAPHIGRWPASIVAAAYTLYPPVHGANLYDFHYPPLGVFFMWLTLYLVESGRTRFAWLAVLLALSVREDIAADTAVMGLYLLFRGKPREGLQIAAVAGVYFLVMKLAIMPRFSGGDESFLSQWGGLVGRGGHGYGAVMTTVLGNPVFTLTSLLESEKFLYVVQLGAPLCFFPWRRPLGYLLSLPGFLFTLTATHYLPLVQISFQYTAHWTAFVFVALVANLEWVRSPRFDGDEQGMLRQRAWLTAIVVLTLLCSYQYGALFQQHTARGGFGPYSFGRTAQAARDYDRLYKLIAKVPPRAKIVSSELIVPQVSSRPDSYTLRVGVFDAEYLLFQLPARDDERREARGALEHAFGVVAREGPFVLAKRGHSKADNDAVLSELR